MTLTLRSVPRTGRPFQANVLVTAWDTDGNERWQLVIGVKTTAGAPTSQNDLESDMWINRLPQGIDRIALSGGVPASGQLAVKGVTLTHAPGANVKVYAGLQAGGAAASDPFAEMSPGVLLRA